MGVEQIALTAAKHGAIVANHTEAVDFLKDSDGKVTGVSVRDRVSDEEFDVSAARSPLLCI